MMDCYYTLILFFLDASQQGVRWASCTLGWKTGIPSSAGGSGDEEKRGARDELVNEFLYEVWPYNSQIEGKTNRYSVFNE
jgi:hypothetical protein